MKTKENIKVLIVRENTIKLSETFIIDHSKSPCYQSELIHGTVPVRFGENPNKGYKLLSKILELTGRLLGNRLFAYHVLLRNIIRRFNPDVLLVEYGTTGAKLYSLCKQLNLPFVVHFHGYDAHIKSVITTYEKEYRKMFETASAIVSVSAPMTENLVRLGADPQKIFLSPSGVDLSKFAKKADPEGDHLKRDNYFITVGRFVEKKAPAITIRAFSLAVQQNPGLKLIMIGDGDLLEECKQLAKELGSAEHIEFLGSRGHSEVRNYMENAYAFLQHSIVASNGDSEGSPVAITEAGAMQLPVVSTRHAGIPRIVIDKVTGLLVDEGDIEGMAECILTLAGDKELAAKMGRNARRHIENNYSQEKSLNRLCDILSWAVSRTERPELTRDII